MAERKIRHVENVFNDESKRGKSGGLFKNKKAPQPPNGKVPLPKIGNYQPKMTLDGTGPAFSHHDIDPISGHVDRRSRSSDDHRRSGLEYRQDMSPSPPPRRKREMIIGDKNVPLTIEHTTDNDNPVPPPRRKRRAPSVPEDGELLRNNPMFTRSMSQRSDEERLNTDFEVQGGDIDFGSGIDNPVFSSRERRISDRSDHSFEPRESVNTEIKRNVIPEPAPDYDDEEVTINFDEQTDELVLQYRSSKSSKPKPVYRDIDGEDFGKYLEEDEYEFDNQRFLSGPLHAQPRKEGRYQKGPKPNAQQSKKQKQINNINKRNTIRDFSFSDSKIGWGDRTVKSTSAKGRNIKREKERNRVDMQSHFNSRPGPGSYSEFLSIKNGIPLESPNSSDSGVEMDDNGRPKSEIFYHHQPKHIRGGGKYEHKPSMWQRLTWRFKRSVDLTPVDQRY